MSQQAKIFALTNRII